MEERNEGQKILNGRILLTPRGIEKSISARKSKETLMFWKFIKTLSPNEIQMLISRRKNDIKYIDNNEDLTQIKLEIKLLEDAYKLSTKRYKDGITVSKIHNFRASSVKSAGQNILNILGFNNNTFYKQEIYYLTDLLLKRFPFNDYNFNCYNETLATLIVMEILNHYEVKFNEKLLLDIHQIKDTYFFDRLVHLHLWCKEHYWKQ
jgi:hypothetical protein